MFWTIFKKRVFLLYMVVCLAGTLLITYSIAALFFVPGVDTGNPLLKGVGSLSGGSSAIIRKQGEQVRIVMDPVEKPLVATYATILGTEGGVVFDAGMSRFRNADSSQADDGQYIRNIADWLEGSSSSAAKGSILFYDLSENPDSSLAAFTRLSRLSDLEFRLATRKDSGVISAGLLEKQSQLWLFFGKGTTLTDPEQKTIIVFCQNGGSLLVVSGENTDLTAANRLATHFGVSFYGSTDPGDKIPVAVASPMFYRAAELLGRLLKITECSP